MILFCDEAQRYDENEYEWLRDVHDHLDRIQIKLFTFMVGRQDLLSIKTNFQHADKTQIVARLMVEELPFFGIRNAKDVATCLAAYGETTFPRSTDWTFTRFYLPHAVDAGYRLIDDAHRLWESFEHIHNKAGFASALEIPMESFTRAWRRVVSSSNRRMQREGMTTGRVTLPILTFEESMLSPSFGYVFNPHWLDPQESIVSILWKFARMNVLSGHTIDAQLAKTGIDPYEGILASRAAVDMRRLQKMLGLQRKLIRGALVPDTLHKISSVHFRFCPRCLRRGYHSVVHQIDTVHHCPIHGDWLQVQCPRCGECSSYRLNARLLGAPFRCAECGTFYGLYAPSFLNRKPLTQQQRVAITRLRFHDFCS